MQCYLAALGLGDSNSVGVISRIFNSAADPETLDCFVIPAFKVKPAVEYPSTAWNGHGTP